MTDSVKAPSCCGAVIQIPPGDLTRGRGQLTATVGESLNWYLGSPTIPVLLTRETLVACVSRSFLLRDGTVVPMEPS